MEEEIKETKTKKSHGVVWFIIFLILVIAGLVCYILIDDGVVEVPNISKTIEEKTKSTKKDAKKEKYEYLSKDNENVKYLYSLVHKNSYIGAVDEMVYNNKKLTLDDMDETYRLNVVSSLFKYSSIIGDIGKFSYITEESVKSAYERVFGDGTYKHVDSINLGCPIYEYDESAKRYIGTDACGGTTSFSNYTTLVDAKKYTDRIEITEAVVFYDLESGNKLYKDYNKKQELRKLSADEAKNVVGDTVYDRVIKPYLESNTDKLQQYTYTFKLADDGFYYYTGVERTQE